MKTRKILIIDDDEVVAGIFRTKFEMEGFTVELAGDGDKALALLRKAPVDLVILDLGLPGTNGVDVLKGIRGRPETKSLPVIAMTNSYLANLVKAAWKAGATKCLTKADCTPRQLVEIVRDVFASSAAQAVTVTGPEVARVSPPVRIEATDAPLLSESETVFQVRLVETFLSRAPRAFATLRQRLQLFTKAWNPNARPEGLFELDRLARAFSGGAGLTGLRKLAHMADAFEALVRELDSKPARVSASSLRTLAHAVDTLGVLIEEANRPQKESGVPPLVLAVDDEAISRELICTALEKVNLRSVSVDDPALAERLVAQNRFDLIFMDVDMPGQDGFALCEKIRAHPTNRDTPVVFVTARTDFETRARSTLSGGNDFITKPFLPLELGVKALSRVLNPGVAKPAAEREIPAR